MAPMNLGCVCGAFNELCVRAVLNRGSLIARCFVELAGGGGGAGRGLVSLGLRVQGS